MGYLWGNYFADGKIMEYVTDKRLSAKSYINYMLVRLSQMFRYEGLPDTIPSEVFEYYLMVNGTLFFTKVEDEYYVFVGSAGGEPDVYYRPTKYVFANPALRVSRYDSIDNAVAPEAKQTVGMDSGVLVRNDTLWIGLMPLLARYATMMAENLVTMRSADVMLRVLAMLTAPDDKTKMAAEIYLKKLEKGEFGVIGENRFFDGVKMQSPPSNNGSYLTQFIELQQYLKGSLYNELGLNANFNMKREALGSNETALNQDALMPLCENMLKCRKEDLEKINKMYNLNIKVDFDSAWKFNMKEMELEVSQLTGGNDNVGENLEGDNRSGSVDEVSGAAGGNSDSGNGLDQEEAEVIPIEEVEAIVISGKEGEDDGAESERKSDNSELDDADSE